MIRQPAQSDPNSHLSDNDLPHHVIMVTDWFHETAFQQFSKYAHNFGSLSRPDTIILNGKGHRLDGDYFGFSHHEIFNVEKSQRYRFRVIDTGVAGCQLHLSIDGHVLTLIATDGYPVQPYDVTSIVLDSADRYDFIVHANRKVDNYWLRIEVCVSEYFKYSMVSTRLLKVDSVKGAD